MDGLSLSVNIITLVDIASKLAALGSAYTTSANGHHREVQHLVRELGTLSGVLEALSTTLQSRSGAAKRASLIDGPLEECKTQLTDLHKMLVKQVSGRNRWMRLGRALQWPLKEKETRVWVERMERFKRTFSLALQADEMGVNGRICSDLEEMKKAQEDARKQKQLARERRKFGQVVSWLAPISATDCHVAIRKLQHTDSGRWFTEGAECSTWKSTDKSFLWLRGNQGSGKTVLTSTIIDHLTAQSQPDERVIYFYCTHVTKPIHLYGSLIAQLLDTSLPLPAYISDYYDNSCHRRPYEHEVKDLVLRLLSSPPNTKTSILIDGLSELPDKTDFLSTIPDLQHTCSVLITSRTDDEITDAFFAEQRVHIDSDLVSNDTAAFVHAELQRRPSLKRLKPELRSEVVSVITGGAESWGWVVAALDLVARMRTDRDVRDALRALMPDDGNDSGVEDLESDGESDD